MKQELKRECFKEKYNFICCNCGYKQWAKPSISMTALGRNSGCGSCLECKKFLHLQIKGGLDGEEMVSILWDDFLKIPAGDRGTERCPRDDVDSKKTKAKRREK